MIFRKDLFRYEEKYNINEAIGYILLAFDNLKISDVINKKLNREIIKNLIYVIQKYKKGYAKCRFYNYKEEKIKLAELTLEEMMCYLLITIERLTLEKAEFIEENIINALIKTLNAYSPEGAVKRANIILDKIINS